MATQHFVDINGKYVGGFGDGAIPPVGSIEVLIEPPDGRSIWNGSAWTDPVLTEDEKVDAALINNKVTLEDRIVALEKKIMENDSTEADDIQAIKDAAK